MKKNYLEYSYFYRAINKVHNRIKLKKQKNFLDIANECNRKKSDYDDLEAELKILYDKKSYLRYLDIYNSTEKPYNKINKPSNETFEKWQESKIKNFLNYNKAKSLANGIHWFDDQLYFTSEIMTPTRERGELITNMLLNKIQEVTIKNNSDFYLINIVQKEFHRPLSVEKQFVFCEKGKELIYSNKAYDDMIKRIFKNIKNTLQINLEEEFGYNSYDFFDGHLNNDANKFVMEKVANFVNK